MEKLLLYAAPVFIVFGAVEAIVMTGKVPRYLATQGIFFVELGLLFLVMATVRQPSIRFALGMVFCSAALVSLFLQVRLFLGDLREQRATEAKIPVGSSIGA